MIKKLRLLTILSVLFLAQGVMAETPVLIGSASPAYPPISHRDSDEIAGASVDIAKRVLEALTVETQIRYFGAWPLVLKLAKRGKVDLITALYETTERKQFLAYTDAYMSDPVVIFVKRHSGVTFNKWSDLKGLQGIALIGDSYGEKFDAYIKSSLDVGRVERIDQGFYDLIIGNSSYFICNLYPGNEVLYREGLSKRIEVLDNPVTVEQVHMAFSKKSPYLKLLPEFNKALKKLIDNGEVLKILREHNIEKRVYQTEVH